MATALKRYNGGRVLVFVLVFVREMSGDVSRICDIITQADQGHVQAAHP